MSVRVKINDPIGIYLKGKGGRINPSQDTGGGGLTPNQVLLAAARLDPRIAPLGASRRRQMGVGAGNQLRTLTTSETAWAQALDRRFKLDYWYDATANQNSMNMNGAIFANDGDGFNQNWNRLPKIVASDFNIVVYDLPTGGIQFQDYDIYGTQIGPVLTVGGYCNLAKQVINYLIANGVAVIVQSLWERNTSAGGAWVSGAAPRLLIPDINATMQAWCSANGIPFIDVRSVYIDPGSSDNNPLASVVRDGTHHTPIGGYIGAKKTNQLLATQLDPAPVSVVETGNLTQNPTMTGTGGTGLDGVLADGLIGSRLQAATATVTASKVTGGQKISIDTSTMTPGTVEGIQLSIALNATTSGVWYQPRYIAEVSAWDGWKGPPGMTLDVGTRDIFVFPPVNAGGSLDNPVGTTAAQGPTEAYIIEPPGGAVLSDTTVSTASLRVYFTAGTGIGEVVFKQVQVYPVTDPTLLMYDESSSTMPSITSSANISMVENADYIHTLTANMLGKWSISGTDVLKFNAPDQHGRMIIPMKDWEDPTDVGTDNVYTVTVTFTPYDLRRSAVTQTLNVTVTNEDDGFTALFNGVSGTDLADYDPTNWTRVGGVPNAIQIHTNGTDAANNGAVAQTAYLSPQQGDTDEQRVSTKVSTVSAKMHRCLRLQDQANALYFTESGGNVIVQRLNSGSPTTIATFTPYKSIAASDIIGAQIYNDNLEVWQNDVPLVMASGSRLINGVLFLDGVKRSGLLSSIAGGSTGNRILDYNNRVAGPHADKVGLKALSMTPLTGSAASNYVGTLSNRTVGSTITVGVTKSAVTQTDWIADGDFIRCPSVTAGTYTVTVTEYFSGAVPETRVTVFTVVIT